MGFDKDNGWTDERLEASRAHHQKELHDLGKLLDWLVAENARLRAALEAVEWDAPPRTKYSGALCPTCHGSRNPDWEGKPRRFQGHYAHCTLMAALGTEEAGVSEVETGIDRPMPPRGAYIDIVFDGPPSHHAGRFVEVEDDRGVSIRVGSWVQRDDGYWVLRLPVTEKGLEAAAREPIEAENARLRALIRQALNYHHNYQCPWCLCSATNDGQPYHSADCDGVAALGMEEAGELG